MSYFPLLSQHLIAALQGQFPERAAELDWSEKEVWYRAGQVSVVRWLAAKQEEQEKTPFSDEEY